MYTNSSNTCPLHYVRWSVCRSCKFHLITTTHARLKQQISHSKNPNTCNLFLQIADKPIAMAISFNLLGNDSLFELVYDIILRSISCHRSIRPGQVRAKLMNKMLVIKPQKLNARFAGNRKCMRKRTGPGDPRNYSTHRTRRNVNFSWQCG